VPSLHAAILNLGTLALIDWQKESMRAQEMAAHKAGLPEAEAVEAADGGSDEEAQQLIPLDKPAGRAG